jgi:hypothetical protein
MTSIGKKTLIHANPRKRNGSPQSTKGTGERKHSPEEIAAHNAAVLARFRGELRARPLQVELPLIAALISDKANPVPGLYREIVKYTRPARGHRHPTDLAQLWIFLDHPRAYALAEALERAKGLSAEEVKKALEGKRFCLVMAKRALVADVFDQQGATRQAKQLRFAPPSLPRRVYVERGIIGVPPLLPSEQPTERRKKTR